MTMKKLKIIKMPLGQMAANCYLIENGDQSIIIDPGANGPQLIDYLENKNLQIRYILLTHGHFDHIGAVDDLAEKYSCQVYIHENDYEMIYNDQDNLSAYYHPLQIKTAVNKVKDHLHIDQFEITFMNLPGHTNGSCFLIFDDYDLAFSGDVLFKNSIGRYDFPTSSVTDTKETLKKIYSMTKDLQIYPGHGENTTLFEEKKNNPFFHA